MKSLTLKSGLAFVCFALVAGTSLAQVGEMSGNQIRNPVNVPAEKGSFLPDESGSLDLEIELADNEVAFGGLQFQVHYDERITGVVVDSCLAGIPETHVGAFTSCDVLPDRNEIRVVITDLGKNRLIPAGLLGVITLKANGPVPADAIAVRGFQALDTEGESMIRAEGGEYIRLRQIR
jgi:hypothetical protein